MRLARPRVAFVLGVASILALTAVTRSFAADDAAKPEKQYQGSIHFLLGSKALASSDTLRHQTALESAVTPNDKQLGMGVETSWGPAKWPVLLALDVLSTSDDGTHTNFDPFV